MPGPPQKRDRDHGVHQGGFQQVGDRQRHDEGRHGQHHIRQATDDFLGPAAEITGDQAKHGADRDRDAEHADDEKKRDSEPEDSAGKDVASGLVGSEPVLQIRRHVAGTEIDDRADMFGIGCEPGRKDRQNQHRQQDQRTDDRCRIAAEAVPHHVTGA
ncbi:hypothetical protein D3C78_1214170 [compost metagenome]